MHELYYTSKFQKDLKKIRARKNFDIKELEKIINALQQGKVLNSKYQNHKLKGEFGNCMECHVKPDILLIYKIDKSLKEIHILRIGSHSDLFG